MGDQQRRKQRRPECRTQSAVNGEQHQGDPGALVGQPHE